MFPFRVTFTNGQVEYLDLPAALTAKEIFAYLNAIGGAIRSMKALRRFG